MTVLRLEHIGIVVDDLAAATAFFAALGLGELGNYENSFRLRGSPLRSRPAAVQ
jgi:catechol 2,3-dioxygenase-like lactoylglutathione lyase family enzyme